MSERSLDTASTNMNLYKGGNLMIHKPLVSGIIIFLNGEKFIQEAIESVFAQTYKNWELLLVDDGSTDSSTAIALGFAQQYPGKVRYLEHEGHQNCGMSAARNLGISNAKGEYIAFVDADDVWLPHKLEQQVAILDLQPETGMVYGSTQFWFSWTGNPEDLQHDSLRRVGIPSNTLMQPPDLLVLVLQDEFQTPTPGICSVLIRKQVIEDIGGFEDTFRGMYEDQAFFAKIYLKSPVFVLGDSYDSRYRQHPDQCCSVATKTGQWHGSQPNPARLTYLNWLADYLSVQEIENTEVWQVLQHALWPYHHPILYRLLELNQYLAMLIQEGFQYMLRQMKDLLKLIGRWILPVPTRHWLQAQRQRNSVIK